MPSRFRKVGRYSEFLVVDVRVGWEYIGRWRRQRVLQRLGALLPIELGSKAPCSIASRDLV